MRNINFNENFFNKWTEQMAYIFGFWYADGCIYMHNYFRNNKKYSVKTFTIGNTDKQIMDDISSLLNVTYCINNPKNKNHKKYYVIQIKCNKFFDFCYLLVGTMDKTNSTSLPNIPPKYLRHFIRGFFDGDGSIFIKKYKSRHGKQITNLCSSFAASKESWLALNELKIMLMKLIFTGNKNIVMQKCIVGSGSKLVYNQYDTMLLCEWIYKDATIFMKRKKKIWDDFDKDKLKDSIKYFNKTKRAQGIEP